MIHTLDMTTTNKETFRSLLQSITCDRFANRDAALAAIDVAFERNQISQLEARKLEAAIE